MKKIFASLVSIVFVFFFSTSALAHPGNTDSSGCHTCRTNCSSWGLYNGQYHCHQAKSTYQPSAPVHSIWGDGGTGYTVPAPEYSYPSYVQTPTCPLMSSYDSISKNCKCYSGYVVGTDILGKQACVSADSKCTDLLGYGGRYNSLNKKCECRIGYIYDGNKCVGENTYCLNLIGLMSRYNSFTKKCECLSGYVLNGSSCVLKKSEGTEIDYSYFNNLLQNNNKSNCVINSTLGSDGVCYCNDGYVISTDKKFCEKLACPINSKIMEHQCVCNTGYILINGVCKTYSESCQSQYGDSSYGDKDYCYCNSGYNWNIDKTKCVKSSGDICGKNSILLDNQCSCLWPFKKHGGVCTTLSDYEKSNTGIINKKLSNRLSGYILSQNEESFTLWWVNPEDKLRYSLESSTDLMALIQKQAKVYDVKTINDFKKNSTKVLGRYLIDHTNWKYYFVNPRDGKFYEIAPTTKNAKDDYSAGLEVLRKIAIGVNNKDARSIAVGYNK